MTTEEIANWIDHIEHIKEDDEAAHHEEDRLRGEFIRYVAEVGPPSLAEKARMVLSTNKINFSRWCA
jgi:hypothetical protein